MKNKDNIIQKVDKGNTVVTAPDNYLNYIINIEKKIKQLFKDLLDNDKINKYWCDKICPNVWPGILYCNPKIHKLVVNNLPKFWPILSVINTPGYNLAKFLIPILEPLNHNEFTVKDSFNSAKEMTTYDSSLYMASLDV